MSTPILGVTTLIIMQLRQLRDPSHYHRLPPRPPPTSLAPSSATWLAVAGGAEHESVDDSPLDELEPERRA